MNISKKKITKACHDFSLDGTEFSAYQLQINSKKKL